MAEFDESEIVEDETDELGGEFGGLGAGRIDHCLDEEPVGHSEEHA